MGSRIRPFSGVGGGNFLDLLRAVFSGNEEAGAEGGNENISLASGANMPFFISVMTKEGRWASLYDKETAQSAFAAVGSVLGEALGSAEDLRETDEEQWRSALEKESVYFDYYGSVPADVLANWLGTSVPPGLPGFALRHILLTVEGQGASLWFRDEGTGKYYSCSTAVKSSAFGPLFSTVQPNGAAFAFELGGGFSRLNEYTLLSGVTPLPARVGEANPLESEAALENLLRVLDIDPQSGVDYTEEKGKTDVYVESSGSLRVSLDGSVLFRASYGSAGVTAGGEALTKAGAVAFARYLARHCSVLSDSGDQDIYLVSVKEEGSSLTVTFNYSFGGIPIRLEDNEVALAASFSGNRLTRLEMNVRAFAQLDEEVTLLPEKLAAAAAGDGRELRLCYVKKTEVYEPVWISE